MAPIYSHSQIQTYQKCPLKYRFEKIDGIPTPKIPSFPLALGSAVHATLEKLYAYRRNLVVAEKESFLARFDEERAKQYADAEQKMAAQHEELLWQPQDIQEVIHRGKQYVEWYYDTYFPFDQAVTDSVEKNVLVSFTPTISFRGIIDRFDIRGNTAIVVDYKTNRSLPKDQQDSIKEQLTLYGAAIKQDYSDKFTEIIGKVIYVHLQREYEFVITPEAIAALQEKYTQLIQEIETKRFAFQMGDEQAFAPSPGWHCDDCPFKRHCPLYKHQYMEDETMMIAELGEKTIKDMIDKVYALHEQTKALNDKKELYLDMLRQYAEQKGYIHKLWGHTATLKVDKKSLYEPDKEHIPELISLLQEKGVRDSYKKEDIDKKKIDQAIKGGDLRLTDFAGYIIQKDTTAVGWPRLIKDSEREDAQEAGGV